MQGFITERISKMKIAMRFFTSLALLSILAGTGIANAAHHEAAAAPAQPNIVDLAASNADFSTLVAAVHAAGLAEPLSGAGPFTVFAPTTAAFAKLQSPASPVPPFSLAS